MCIGTYVVDEYSMFCFVLFGYDLGEIYRFEVTTAKGSRWYTYLRFFMDHRTFRQIAYSSPIQEIILYTYRRIIYFGSSSDSNDDVYHLETDKE